MVFPLTFSGVTLSIDDNGDTETDVDSSRNDEPPAPQDANIWYPEIPDPRLSFVGVPGLPGAYRNRQDEMPLSTILFGGLKGELLCHIVKMTVWIVDNNPGHYVVWGIGFTFDCLVEGKNSLVLGYSRDDGEYDFPIDGRGGERICQIDRIFQYSWASHLRFRVRLFAPGRLSWLVFLWIRCANLLRFFKRFIQLETESSNSRRPSPTCVLGKTLSSSLSLYLMGR